MATCIITGIGSGIGKATAVLMSQKNYYDNYVLIGRNESAISQTINEMKLYVSGQKLAFYKMDLAESDSIPKIIADAEANFGEIKCLLNIAGYTDPEPLLSTTMESFEMTYRINVFAPFMLIRECTKYMKKYGGKILNVASTAGMTPRPGWLSYASSKAALISMSETLTAELAEYGIMVYCVSPGRCATKLRKRLAPDENPATIMQPKDVAEVICRLINPAEQCLDGQNIVIRKQIKHE